MLNRAPSPELETWPFANFLSLFADFDFGGRFEPNFGADVQQNRFF
jgi:hypothetical protein